MSDSEDALASLRWLAIERVSGSHVGSNRLIQAGLDALLEGVDTPSLRLLAGLGQREGSEAPELFVRVVEELGLAPDLPSERDQALWAMARWWAELIVKGKLDPLKGADLIYWRVAVELGHPEQLRAIVAGAIAGGDWSDEWTIPLEQIKSDIVRSSHEFLATQGSTS